MPRTARRGFAEEPLPMRMARWFVLIVAVPFALLLSFAMYRRWIQVRSLSVSASGTALRSGSSVVVEASSWATTTMTVHLELVQGARAETLLVHRLLPNAPDPTMDPRPRHATVRVVLTEAQLARYRAGEAVLRATARGRSQLLHTPTPVVRELAVTITPATPSSSSGRDAQVAARPFAVDEAPRAPTGVLVAQ